MLHFLTIVIRYAIIIVYFLTIILFVNKDGRFLLVDFVWALSFGGGRFAVVDLNNKAVHPIELNYTWGCPCPLLGSGK